MLWDTCSMRNGATHDASLQALGYYRPFLGGEGDSRNKFELGTWRFGTFEKSCWEGVIMKMVLKFLVEAVCKRFITVVLLRGVYIIWRIIWWVCKWWSGTVEGWKRWRQKGQPRKAKDVPKSLLVAFVSQVFGVFRWNGKRIGEKVYAVTGPIISMDCNCLEIVLAAGNTPWALSENICGHIWNEHEAFSRANCWTESSICWEVEARRAKVSLESKMMIL